jgi:putative transposase
LIVKDDGESNIIPQSIGLIAGRTAQENNRRKLRKGAFWEDRYHSTAIETGEHLLRCLVYIDLNMVRAGVVRHPSELPHGGYNEIQTPDQYLDNLSLASLLLRRLEKAGYKCKGS